MKSRGLQSLPLLILVALLGCSCRDEVISTVSSPDGLHTATILSKDCGATTSEYTRVTVRPGPGGSGDQVVFAARYPQRIGLSWKGPSDLVVRCDSCRDEQITFQLLR